LNSYLFVWWLFWEDELKEVLVVVEIFYREYQIWNKISQHNNFKPDESCMHPTNIEKKIYQGEKDTLWEEKKTHTRI
jgi:hypothetical protein